MEVSTRTPAAAGRSKFARCNSSRTAFRRNTRGSNWKQETPESAVRLPSSALRLLAPPIARLAVLRHRAPRSL